jgi:uncharacterized protein
MNILFEFQENVLRNVTNDFRRTLHDQINWKQRMIGIKGPRGAGKTTLMLQHLKFDLGMPKEALYITADHTWFYTNTLWDTANEWFKSGGKILFIDEVHKYKNWSTELKNIYDGFPEMQVIFTASSALHIHQGTADLSRRVISYELPGLSFREYLLFTQKISFNSIHFNEITLNHRDISRSVTDHLRPLPAFRQYLKNGYLPFFKEGEDSYFLKLNQIINTIVDSDLAYTSSWNSGVAFKIKKLLGVIAESVPFKPNIAALAGKLDLSRDSVYLYINLLKEGRLLNNLIREGKGVSILQKPEKIFLENTNLAWALKDNPDTGNLRETFVLNQLLNAGYETTAPEEGDFLTEGVVIEVGGKSKSNAQVKHNERYLLAADDIETGAGNKLPLWLLGFLY